MAAAEVAVAVDGPLIEEDGRGDVAVVTYRLHGDGRAGVNCFSVQIFSAPIKKHVRSLLPYNLIHAVVIPKIIQTCSQRLRLGCVNPASRLSLAAGASSRNLAFAFSCISVELTTRSLHLRFAAR